MIDLVPWMEAEIHLHEEDFNEVLMLTSGIFSLPFLEDDLVVGVVARGNKSVTILK